MNKRIKYGISKCYYAPITAETDAAVTYGTPVALPGAVALVMNPQNESIEEYADNVTWYYDEENNGYTGSLEVEDLPEAFYTDILGYEKKNNGLLVEKANAQKKMFALLFQFEIKGDSGETPATGKRGVMYRCSAGRPSSTGNTKTNTFAPQHDTVALRAMPRIHDSLVKASCESTGSAYATWFDAVSEPAA